MKNMVYTCIYKSKLGEILLAADEIGLTGLWFSGQKYFASTLPDEHIPRETPVLSEAKEWLDVYFSGKKPAFTPLTIYAIVNKLVELSDIKDTL